MPNPSYPNDDDAQFNEWRTQRTEPPPDVAASVTFMELMRQAAARNAPEPEPPPRPRRRRTTSTTMNGVTDGTAAADNAVAMTDGTAPPQNASETMSSGAFTSPPPAFVPVPFSETPAEGSAPPARRSSRRKTKRTLEDPSGEAAGVPPAEGETLSIVVGAGGEIHPASAIAVPDPAEGATDAYGFDLVPEARPPTRTERRRAQRTRATWGAVGGFVRAWVVIAAAALLTATIFTWFTPPAFLSVAVRNDLSAASAPATAVPQPTQPALANWERRIGIVSGHRGPENDPGAVCPDGLTEAEINFNVAQAVVSTLQARGYSVDLLDEFDPRLEGYQASALVSIHANTCRQWPGGEVVSGFLIAGPAARISARGSDDLLVGCIARSYANATGLALREGTTIDMTDYHNFREIHAMTPGAILELGFLLADRELLTERPDDMTRGVVEGILCFLEPASRQTTETF